MRHTSDCPWYIGRGGACTCDPEPATEIVSMNDYVIAQAIKAGPGTYDFEKEKPAPEPLDPRDYEIACLKFRNKQLHHHIAVLEALLRKNPWAAGEGEV